MSSAFEQSRILFVASSRLAEDFKISTTSSLDFEGKIWSMLLIFSSSSEIWIHILSTDSDALLVYEGALCWWLVRLLSDRLPILRYKFSSRVVLGGDDDDDDDRWSNGWEDFLSPTGIHVGVVSLTYSWSPLLFYRKNSPSKKVSTYLEW